MTEDAVGFKKPPKSHRFQPGRSGNPGGRPKKRWSVLEDLRHELDQPHAKETKQRALVKRLVAEALRGDLKATQLVISLARALGEGQDENSDETDQEVLDQYVRTKISTDKGE